MAEYQIQRIGKKTLSTELKKRVSVQAVTMVSDGQGGNIKTWSDSYDTWAAVDPIKAEQVEYYSSIGVDATHRIKIRGQNALVASNRIKYGSRIFEILTVEDLQEQGVLKIATCKERR